MKIIIIGGVAGGATTAARLRRMDEKAEIILLERGKYVSYANCGLPYYIGDIIDERDNLFVQTTEGFNARFNIDIRTQSEVIDLSPSEKTITIRKIVDKSEYTEKYDKLVISTGAEPIKPPLPGIESKKIFLLRNVSDTDKIKDFINIYQPSKATIIGAGFIGLEMAENLHNLGLNVSIIERSNQVMAPIDYPMATMVHQHLREKGVNLYLQENVDSFEEQQGSLIINLDGGKRILTDLVILSIGVRPETKLAKDAGLDLGTLGGIVVNSYLQTSNEDIYALGDAIEVFNPVIGKSALIPLAGPANKQGRIVADNIIDGNIHEYKGTVGTAIAKVFDLSVATTGASSKLLDKEGIQHITSFTHGHSHAGYYPGALPLSIKINFSESDGKLLGVQIVGYEGVDKRIDLFAQTVRNGGTIYDLQEIEHAYAPPFSSAKDPVNMAGFVAENILKKQVDILQYYDIDELNKTDLFLIDVRTNAECEMGMIDGAVNIPVDEIRTSLSSIPHNKQLVLYCAVGLRGYVAARILKQLGYTNVYNLSGGYKIYSSILADRQAQNLTNKQKISSLYYQSNERVTINQLISIDACGLQCPGPIMKLKKKYDEICNGQRLEIKVTDQAFSQDLKGWCNMVGAKLIEIKNSKGVLTAQIEKRELDDNVCPVKQQRNHTDGKTIIVFSNDLDKAIASFIIANGAVASGKKVSMFFTFWGLTILQKQQKPKVKKDFLGKMFEIMLPSSSQGLKLSQMNMGGLGSRMMRYMMKRKNIETLESLMGEALSNGVEFIACSMSMDVMGIKKEELIDNITIGGVAAYLDKAEQSNVNLFI